jgi:hypothetical protein
MRWGDRRHRQRRRPGAERKRLVARARAALDARSYVALTARGRQEAGLASTWSDFVAGGS